jgi:hypothetical protein
MKPSHQVDEQKSVGNEDLDQVVTDDHRKEKDQAELIECQHQQELFFDERTKGDV